MKRRGWLLAATGAAAAAGGIGWQWRHERAATDETRELWTMRFPKPDGGELVMAELRGRPLLLNFWATWCAPCVKEMPDLDRFHRDFSGRGWQVVGLAIDSPAPVREFLQRAPVGYTIGLAGFDGADLSRLLGNPQGALPFTVLIDRDGRVVQRKLGPSDVPELVRWAQSL